MNNINSINFKQDYIKLHSSMYSVIEPNHITNGDLVLLNESLSKELGIDDNFLKSREGVNLLSGNTNEYGTLFAQAYAGHQYGYFTTLGDGRAVIIGEQVTPDNKKYDLQLKGFGRTPYSRRGDGKATLYSMLREYLISEAMHYLNIPTTRSLSVVKTNENIIRQEVEQGGILTRVASSHIRVGTFEYASATGGIERVKELADYAINLHYPELQNEENKYVLFFDSVIKKQAELVAKWQSVGFVHGVMNTDNMTISGETIDYGPCAFLDQFNPSYSFSSIDQNNRYAYKQQPYIASWNLSKLAETLLELFSDDLNEAVKIANNELRKFQEYFESHYYELMANKIGILKHSKEDKPLVDELLLIMTKYKADFTNTFRLLTLDKYKDISFYGTEEWNLWFQKWTRQLGYRKMNIQDRILLMEQSNPVLIPRNLLVEEALLKASKENNYSLLKELLQKIRTPFNYRMTHEDKFIEPFESKEEYVTYCGT